MGHEALDLLGLDPLELDVGAELEPAVLGGLDHRQVGVGQGHVLADDPDAHRLLGGLDLGDQGLPLAQVGCAHVLELEHVADHGVEPLLVQDERDLVDVAGVGGVDHPVGVHVAQAADLVLQVLGDRSLGPHDDGVGLDAPAAQLGDRVLGGLGLLLAGRPDEGHERDVHVADVAPADVEAELPDGLEEREDLDVADGAADLGDDHVDVVAGQHVDAALDLVGDVRDDLDGLAQVVATALGGQHGRVDRPGGGVGVLGEALVEEALVVPQVEVGLAAVVGDEDFAVLEGVHRPGVDVDVRVELLDHDPQAPGLEQASQRGGGEPLAEAARHATRHEDVFRHGSTA